MITDIPGYKPIEELYESPCTVVLRAVKSGEGLPFVLKILKPDAVSAEALARFRREFEIALKLSLPGTCKAYGLEPYRDSLMMVLEDIGGQSLEELLRAGPLPLERFLLLGISLADILDSLHQQRVIHKSINPSNIIVSPSSWELRLTDFGLADELPQSSVSLQPAEALEGDLNYIAPEQTGRMNRLVDYRADFYSLGVTFYRMLTGKVPFEAADALGTIYGHIAGTPTAPHELAPATPRMVSEIVLKLMSKMAEDRYQSAWGLKSDLKKCLRELADFGQIAKFETGREDVSDRLGIPQKLYGRGAETDLLLAAFERARSGNPGILLLSGSSGVGKTALAHEICAPITERNGLFINGKFDLLRRNTPYSGWAQAFRVLARYILMESQPQLTEWKMAILNAVGANGKVLTEAIPDLEFIIGKQPPVAELDAAGAQARFNDLFNGFLKAVASGRHPLVVFLDDLQWADPASLKLLENIAEYTTGCQLLIIGSFRDSEVTPEHPLMKALGRIRANGLEAPVLALSPLTSETLNVLLADTFHSDPIKVEPFAELLYRKTAGNPFFVSQYLKALHREGLVKFDKAGRGWRWDLAGIRAKGFTSNVADLMIAKLANLSAPAREQMKLAACIGNTFTLGTLARITGQTEAEVLDILREALSEGLILNLNAKSFSFLHDRVYQAAYSLIPEDAKAALHLRVGRILLNIYSSADNEGDIFQIAGHLNLGATLITAPDEKARCAQVNLMAGEKAMNSTAYLSAAAFFTTGLALLSPDSADKEHPLAYSLHTGLAEATFLGGDPEAAGKICERALAISRSNSERARIFKIKIDILTTLDDIPSALAAGTDCLRLLGIDLPLNPTGAQVQTQERLADQLLGTRDPEALADLPDSADPDTAAGISILATMHPPSHLIDDHNLYLLIPVLMFSITLRRGNTPHSATTYGMYASVLLARGRIAEGYRFLEVASALAERSTSDPLRAKAFFIRGASPFFGPIAVSQDYLDRALQLSQKAGDITFSCYCRIQSLIYSFIKGAPLDQVSQETVNCLEFARKARFQMIMDLALCQGFLLQTLRGEAFRGIRGEYAALTLADFERTIKNKAHTWYWHLTLRLQANFIEGDYEGARLRLNELRGREVMFLNEPVSADYYFFAALTLAASCQTAAREEMEALKKSLDECISSLQTRNGTYPEVYQCRLALAQAERARVEGRSTEAIPLYEEAIASARKHGFIHNEALAYELASKFWLSLGNEDFARAYMGNAQQKYAAWQAWAKVKALQRQHPQWLGATVGKSSDGTAPRPPAETGAGSLDTVTLVKAFQAMSGETRTEKILPAIMRIVIENAGAQKGWLSAEESGQWMVIAEGDTEHTGTAVSPPIPIEESRGLPAGIVRYVARTKQAVILDDAAKQADFASDPQIRGRRVKSLLCAPLLARGRLIGVVYLENLIATHSFTPEKVQLLNVLLAQAAISIENARGYEALREREAALRESENEYRRIVDTANEGVWVLDKDLRCAFVNNKMAEMLGFRPAEMLGLEIKTFVFDEDLPGHIERMDSRRRGLTEQYEHRWRRKDGSELWTIVSAKPSFDPEGSFNGTFAMVTDITRRKRAERELAESERKYRTLVETLNEGVWMMDKDTRTTYVNPRAAEMLGYSAEDMLGRKLGYFMEEKNGKASFAVLSRSAGEDGEQRDYELIRKDGTRVYAIFKVTPLLDESGNCAGTLAAVTDITDRKKLQRDLELVQKLNVKTEELRQANTKLREMDRLKSMFIASMSHELRTPLNSVIGFSSILLKEWCGLLNQEQKENLSTILSAGKHLQLLISDVIDVSKIEAGKLEIETENFDVHGLITEAAEMIRTEKGTGHLEIVASCPHLNMNTDRRRLLQCVINLLSNAAKFTVRGRISIAARPAGCADASRAADCLEISVTDTGIGIKPEDIPKLFSPFHRLRSPLTSRTNGTGLGLYLVKKIATEVLQGDVFVRSVYKQGSVFWLKVPVNLRQE